MTTTKPVTQTLSSLRPHIPWLLASFLGALLSITLFVVVGAWERTRLQAAFEQVAQGRANAVLQSVNNSLEVLQALGGLFAASRQVERDEFRQFCEMVLPRHPEIQSLEWIPRVTLGERPYYEAGRRSGFPVQIIEVDENNKRFKASRRPEYFPVEYTEPLLGNEGVIGFDVASEGARREAMEKARDSASQVATARVHLFQKPDDRFGVIVFLPVYRGGAALKTEDRRKNLQGYVLAVFDIQRMVEVSLVGMQPSAASLALFDESASAQERLLYRHRPAGSGAEKESESPAKRRLVKKFEWSTYFDVGGRTWSISAAPTAVFFATHHNWLPWVVLVFGILLTLLLANVLANGLRRSLQVERLVTQRTADLTKAVAQRTLAEQALRIAHDELELKVQERTAELSTANQRLKAYNEQVRQMALRLQTVREDERTGIARELHDALGQLLTSLKMDLVWISGKLLSEQVSEREELSAMTKLVDQMVETVQRISSELRPRLLDDFGLPEAIRWQGQEFQRLTGIRCVTRIEAGPLVMDPACSISLFRILQEALTNVARHAKASEVVVRLSAGPGSILLEISDDGQGITAEQLENKGSLGLLGMQERALLIQGELAIAAGLRGRGTHISIRVPVDSALIQAGAA